MGKSWNETHILPACLHGDTSLSAVQVAIVQEDHGRSTELRTSEFRAAEVAGIWWAEHWRAMDCLGKCMQNRRIPTNSSPKVELPMQKVRLCKACQKLAATGQKTEILEIKQCWEMVELWFSQNEEIILTPWTCS